VKIIYPKPVAKIRAMIRFQGRWKVKNLLCFIKDIEGE
jgi:hypothetical protein